MNGLNVTRAMLGIALLGALGCGQKGPLYLPDHNGAVVTRPASQNNGAAPPATQQPAAAPKTDAAPAGSSAPTKKKSSDKDDEASPAPK